MAAGAGIRREQIRGFGLRSAEVTTENIVDGTIQPGDLNSAVYGGVPPAVNPDDAGTAGVATTLSRSDHEHPFPCATPSDLTETQTSAEGSSSSSARADHTHATTVLPWGLVARQTLTAASSTFTGDSATDMVLNNVSVVQGRLYMALIAGLADMSAATGQWQLNLHVNGTFVGTFTRLVNEVAGAARHPINGVVFWTAPTTQATDDFTVEADERTGTSDVTLVGGTDATNPPRTFAIFDVGVAV